MKSTIVWGRMLPNTHFLLPESILGWAPFRTVLLLHIPSLTRHCVVYCLCFRARWDCICLKICNSSQTLFIWLTETFYYIHSTGEMRKWYIRRWIQTPIVMYIQRKILCLSHLTTSPRGLKPCLSKNAFLSFKLMNNWVVRVFGPAVANTTVPRLFVTFTGSSRRFWERHLACTCGLVYFVVLSR